MLRLNAGQCLSFRSKSNRWAKCRILMNNLKCFAILSLWSQSCLPFSPPLRWLRTRTHLAKKGIFEFALRPLVRVCCSHSQSVWIKAILTFFFFLGGGVNWAERLLVSFELTMSQGQYIPLTYTQIAQQEPPSVQKRNPRQLLLWIRSHLLYLDDYIHGARGQPLLKPRWRRHVPIDPLLPCCMPQCTWGLAWLLSKGQFM